MSKKLVKITVKICSSSNFPPILEIWWCSQETGRFSLCSEDSWIIQESWRTCVLKEFFLIYILYLQSPGEFTLKCKALLVSWSVEFDLSSMPCRSFGLPGGWHHWMTMLLIPKLLYLCNKFGKLSFWVLILCRGQNMFTNCSSEELLLKHQPPNIIDSLPLLSLSWQLTLSILPETNHVTCNSIVCPSLHTS